MIRVIGGVGSTRGSCKYQEDRGMAKTDGNEGPVVLAIYDGHVTDKASDYCRKHMRTVMYQLIQRSKSVTIDTTTTPGICKISEPLDKEKFVEIGGCKTKDDDDDDDDYDLDDDCIIDPEDDDVEEYSNLKNMQEILIEGFKIVNAAFLGTLEDGGCTACFATLVNGKLWIANTGDSRCIVCGKDGAVRLATKDHKPTDAGEKARICAAGHTVEETSELVNGSLVYVARVDGDIAVSRSIGDSDYKDAGVEPENQALTCVPDVSAFDVGTGFDGFVVLASDGLWDVMSNEKVGAFVAEKIKGLHGNVTSENVQAIAQELVMHATKTLGSGDNTTAVVAVFSK